MERIFNLGWKAALVVIALHFLAPGALDLSRGDEHKKKTSARPSGIGDRWQVPVASAPMASTAASRTNLPL
jgi:hypothetical protein